MSLCKALFNWNLIFLEHVGYLDDRKRRSFFVISIPIAIWFLGFYKLLTVFGDFKKVVSYLFVDVGLTMVNFRACIFIFKREKFLSLFSNIEKWNMEFKLENDATTIKNLQEFTRNCGRVSKYIFRIIVLCIFYSMISKLFTNQFIIEVCLPGIDLYDYPYYLIVSALQDFWMAPVCLLTYAAYMCVMCISISFGIFLMKDIQYKLENMQEMDEEEALKCIKKCLTRHALIIKFHQDLEALFSLGNFMEITFFCIIPCMIIFYSTMEYDLANLIRDIQFVGIGSFSTFTTFWLANNFCLESINISHAAYNSNWMDRGKEFRRSILLIMIISQKSLKLTAGGIKPLNMEFLMVIVHSTYSIFTILQGTVNNN